MNALVWAFGIVMWVLNVRPAEDWHSEAEE
jgi:hypothetical protein